MMGVKEKSLQKALEYCFLTEIPEEENKKNIWIRAIAEVQKKDGSFSYVYAEKDSETLKNTIKVDFGRMVQIHKVIKYHPFCYLDAIYMPVFKYNDAKDEAKAIKERVAFLDATSDKKHDKMSLKELNQEVLKRAIKKQLNVEKGADYAKRKEQGAEE